MVKQRIIRINFIKYCIWTSIVLLCLAFFSVQALSIENEWWVTDWANILSEEEEASLENKIQSIVDATSAEIALVTVESLWWREAFDVSLDFARYLTDDQDKIDEMKISWVWDEELDNWLVVLVAPNERKRQIQVWYWLEWAIPDAIAKRMWENILVPAFRQESYWSWLWELVLAFESAINWEVANRDKKEINKSPMALTDLFIGFVFLIFFFWPIVKPYLKNTNEKLFGSWTWWTIFWIIWSLIVWWSGLWLILPLALVFMIVFFWEAWKGNWSSWISYGWWWSFGWGFSWFSWWSFGWGWAWWWR